MIVPSLESNRLMTEPPGGRLASAVQLAEPDPLLSCAFAMAVTATSPQAKRKQTTKALIVF